MKIKLVQDREFVAYQQTLLAGATIDKTSKGMLLIGILKDLKFVDENTFVALDESNYCVGLMVMDTFDLCRGVEIEQWVTGSGTKGVGKIMLSWLIEDKKYAKVKLMPTLASKPAYQKMGFKEMEGGFMIWEVPPPPPPE